MNNKHSALLLIILLITTWQRCGATENNTIKNFSNTFKNTNLFKRSNHKEQFICHALGLFISGYTYQQYKSPTISALTYGSISFGVCPVTINSYKWLKTKAKHWILERSEIERPQPKIKKK